MVEISDPLKSIDYSKVTAPIQLLAIILGGIVIALIVVSPQFQSENYPLSYISIFAAICITIIVFQKFLKALASMPWIFWDPNGLSPEILQAILAYHLDSR